MSCQWQLTLPWNALKAPPGLPAAVAVDAETAITVAAANMPTRRIMSPSVENAPEHTPLFRTRPPGSLEA